MFFSGSGVPAASGFSLHGTYWHNNFGHPMSHGCVNMRTSDAEKLFYWTNPNVDGVSYASADNPGTFIKVYGTTPKE
jgi:lipoprotein-anchoring transpeptidase ErfK/SrfK